jgi:hypothetical protein
MTARNKTKCFWGVEYGWCVRLRTLPPYCLDNMGSLTSHNPVGLHGLLTEIYLLHFFTSIFLYTNFIASQGNFVPYFKLGFKWDVLLHIASLPWRNFCLALGEKRESFFHCMTLSFTVGMQSEQLPIFDFLWECREAFDVSQSYCKHTGMPCLLLCRRERYAQHRRTLQLPCAWRVSETGKRAYFLG